MPLSILDCDVPESAGEFRGGPGPHPRTLGSALNTAPVRDSQLSQNKPAMTLQQRYDSTPNPLSSPSRRSAPSSNASESRIKIEHGPDEDDSRAKGDDSKRGSNMMRTGFLFCPRNDHCLLLKLC
jgi:hypothetical protein